MVPMAYTDVTSLFNAWQTSNQVSIDLIAGLPAPLWRMPVPGEPRRTVRSILAHLHNARCTWVRTLGSAHGIPTPKPVDPRTVTRRQLTAALRASAKGIEGILDLGVACGGRVPPSKAYVWRNLALDIGHILTYFVAHEGHHRGQIVLIARQSGYRLPPEALGKLWRWKPRPGSRKR